MIKNLLTFCLCLPFALLAQTEANCRFPFQAKANEALVHVWLQDKPTLDSQQVAKIKQKRISSRYAQATVDSLWQQAKNWLQDRLGEDILCRHVSGSFPHFTGEGDNFFLFEFRFDHNPQRPRSDFFSFQLVFKRLAGQWQLQPPTFLPPCHLFPDSCQVRYDRNETRQLAQQQGIRADERFGLLLLNRPHNQPFIYKIHKTHAAGQCQDSVWLFDRRTGIFGPPTVARTPQCVTYEEMIAQTPIIVEAQELRGYSFQAGTSILTSHAYRVLQVFKGDSIPDFIEVVQGGGQIKSLSSHWSHGTVPFLDRGQTGLLFLQAFSRKYAHTRAADSSYFRYKPYIPYGTQLAYGRPSGPVCEERIADPEHLLFAPIEAHTGHARTYRQPGQLRNEQLLEQMRRWGYGYRCGQAGVLVHLNAQSWEQEQVLSVALEASPTPIYLDSIRLLIRYDTSILGTAPVADSLLSMYDSHTLNIPSLTYYDSKLMDAEAGVLALELVRKLADRRHPNVALQPNGYALPLALLQLKLPPIRPQTVRFELVDFDAQPGGRYVRMPEGQFHPLAFVAGVKVGLIDPNAPLQLDTLRTQKIAYPPQRKYWQTTLYGEGVQDTHLEVWVPIWIAGKSGGKIPSYQCLPPQLQSLTPDGGLHLIIKAAKQIMDTELPIQLRNGPIYLARPGRGEGMQVLKLDNLPIKEE
ncbi:MAG: hypothetical protein D6772_02115 [Bacteroidetes bacterium]|nr:MAG: hypothetical protein D6772_02115 [Bacteroidota bacterium]